MKISVCIAAIRPTTVKAAIESVLRQTYTNWELLIVGQGSDTELQAVGKAAAEKDARIRYVHLQNCGLSLAHNAGRRAATGEIIAFLDDDCEAKSDWLEVIASEFNTHPDVDVIAGSLVAPEPAKKGLTTCPGLSPTEVTYDPLASGRKPPVGFGLIGANYATRLNLVEKYGFEDECLGPGTPFPAANEIDYLLRLEAAGVKMRSTPRAEVLHTYGRRYGLKALFNFSSNYANGNGALAGKLTLMGDPRGKEWLANTRHECTIETIKKLKFHRLPFNLYRMRNYFRAYKLCTEGYKVDPAKKTLYPLKSS